jgi:UDP-N-acetyl-D-glucosamine dehydrogenase
MERLRTEMKVCIVGLGYVGLPLAIQFARSGATVIGLDIDQNKVDQVNRGRSYIKHIATKTISDVLKAKRLTASTDSSILPTTPTGIIENNWRCVSRETPPARSTLT